MKVDGAGMANSLEVRSPFLDPDIVEFSARCPVEYKLSLTQTKVLLRHASRSLLPGEIVWNRKRGFAPPLGKWLRGALKDFCRDLLGTEKIRREGLFNPEFVENLIEDHMATRANNSRLLWTLLVFEQWKDRQCT